ncbi:Hypothetical protein GbCGDNIH3_5015 [Granulibacter bethesdensis]|uniref:Uncharacterized protein n=1 Tax=Granulibacter bethesdensis TaxID=364410 RepID=A0AAN0VF55_9PROT|nr:Hypothetical protein GbCGDNIH3_5015 [Granulibacter bethesdensis]
MHQLLGIGIRNDEIDTGQIERDHVVNRVRAAAAYTDHGNARGEICVHLLRDGQVQSHGRSPPWALAGRNG